MADEAAFIEIHYVCFAMAAYPVPQGAQERYSFFVTTLSIFGRFFLVILSFFSATQIELIRTPKWAARSRNNASGKSRT